MSKIAPKRREQCSQMAEEPDSALSSQWGQIHGNRIFQIRFKENLIELNTIFPIMAKFFSTIIIILFSIHASHVLKAQPNPDSGYSAGTGSEFKKNILVDDRAFIPRDNGPGEKKIYREIDLENFETNLYTKKNTKFRFNNGTKASIGLRSEFPAPIFGSTKFLALKLFGEKANTISIFPAKPIIIRNYCKKINIWAYGRGLSARLGIIIKDSRDNIYRLSFGALKFRGWKKLSIEIPSRMNQADQYLNQKNRIQVIALIYNPSNKFGNYKWSLVYLDDLTAIVRKKYSDKEAMNW